MTFKIKDTILGIIIAIVLVMFLAYGTNLVYERPDYDDFCGAKQEMDYETKEDCESAGGKWNPSMAVEEPRPVGKEGYCDASFTCRQEWENVDQAYSRNMFIISLVVGLIIIIVSALFIEIGSIYGGLMLGSLFFIIYGTGNYWRYMNDWLRFIILGIALVILIYLGYRLAKRE